MSCFSLILGPTKLTFYKLLGSKTNNGVVQYLRNIWNFFLAKSKINKHASFAHRNVTTFPRATTNKYIWAKSPVNTMNER